MTEPIRLLPSNPKSNFLAHRDEINAAIARVMESGWYILGKEVERFENEFASYIGVRFGIGVGNGTEALHLALRACGIGPGDEVITVSHTAVATVVAIELCGAIPVLVDIDLNTYTIDPTQIESAITQRTKALIPVHMYGHPADMNSVMAIADRYELCVIEDCAQSHGSICEGCKTGAWGSMAAFSFYPTKNLGAIGDGGMVVTNDPQLAEQVRLLREYGWRQRYISESSGLNSRLDELQAAILRVKLRYLDEDNNKRQSIAEIYNEALSRTSLSLPVCLSGATHVYHQYVIRSRVRDSLKDFLRKKGIGTLIHYPVPIHRQPAYQGRLRCNGSMVATETAVGEILSLPIYPELPHDQVFLIAEAAVSWDRDQGNESAAV
jgi:dTDP-4-amino-4,6-dideoxygalactose transaminase